MNNKLTPTIIIHDFWIKWWGKDDKHAVCLIVEIDNELHLLEQELEQS